jgi:hypothetical protein
VTAPARVDHLVVVASSLAEGAAWCQDVLGVTPGPGGQHPLMGTHNRLMRIATVDFPRAYFEIIAIDPTQRPQRGDRRWFDMDDEALQAAVRERGPRLVHFVANVPDVQQAVAAWKPMGLDRGPPLQASRETPRGLLEWRITVRPDGQRLLDGCLPTLIQWGETHPAAGMPDSGVYLQSMSVTHPRADRIATAFAAIGLEGIPVLPGEANLCAQLHTPRGLVKLESKGL